MVKKERDDMMMQGVQIVDVPVHWINEGEKRLDAGFYAQDVIKARILMDKVSQHLEIQAISELSSRIFWPGRFKRQYVSKKDGEPFLMPSEVFMFLPKPTKYVINYPSEVKVKRNWILITRSGTVGRVLITTKYLENFVLSDDLIRVHPKENNFGFLYAYLNTWIGQAFLTKDQYGATVKHIEPHHVANIPIPRIPDLEEEINQKILEAHKLREEAQELLLKAEEMIYSELGLPKIDEEDVEYFGGEIGRLVKAFEVKASELDYRLDASYHVPILRLIKEKLKKGENRGEFQLTKLRELCKAIFIPPRFKRPYVKNPSEGIPFLSGTHLIEIKPLDVKYLWNRYKKITLYKVYKNWILISARGTVGRPYLITTDTPIAASDNILRCVPDRNKVLPAYLTAFLHTSYSAYQFQAQKAGSVQDLLQPTHAEDILIPLPSKDVQDKIGSLVIEAYNKEDKANLIEEEAIKELETYLMKIAGGV